MTENSGHSTTQAVPFEFVEWTDLRRHSLEKRLRREIEGDVRFDRASCVLYSTDASPYQIEPIGVVHPASQADLVRAVCIAMEQRVPIVPRGAGTSLSGQAIGPGLVIDCSKHLCHILETDFEAGWVRVEPGVILADLNRYLARQGMQFGPDVATIDRANLGGMIGNNSAGARSIKYGKTIDHVLELDVILTDGRVATFKPVDEQELRTLLIRSDRLGEIYRTVRHIVGSRATEIDARFPKILRRVSGYNLDALLPPDPINVAKLIVGSEGTLATVSAAKLKIVPIPVHRGIAVVHYDSIEDALGSLNAILETGPSAVELIDRMIMDLARENADYCSQVAFVQGRPAAIYVVEYFTDTLEDLDRCFEQLRDVLGGLPAGPIVEARQRQECEQIWNLRKTALPLLLSLPGARKPVAFVEDTAVDPSVLPSFVARFKQILHQHGTDGSFYGHASVGCLHIRPLLNLRSAADLRDMESIADQVADLVVEFGGAMSGEHGDGLARSRYNRKLFGDAIYESFLSLKKAFDPDNLMNPGKIVDGPPVTENLRTERSEVLDPTTVYAYSADRGIYQVVDQCNGNGLCRREHSGTMCPSYMATRDEQHSPRGRANLLRGALEGRFGAAVDGQWASPELRTALDLCLMCKACKSECPSRVDVAKLKAEYMFQRWQRQRPPARDRLFAAFPQAARLGARWAPFSNWLLRAWPTRWWLDRFLGIDRRRKLPALHRRTFERWFRNHTSICQKPRGRVLLLADCFTNIHSPDIGRAAVLVLEKAGYQVHLAPICCGRILLSKGFLNDASALARANIPRLLPFAEEGVPILGLEPSCLLTLSDEWCDLAPGSASTLIARQVRLVDVWLAERLADGTTSLELPDFEPIEVLLHGHCHQKAAGQFDGTVEAVKSLAGAEPIVLDAGCCGMAGSFGYEKNHYDLSVAVAEQRLLPALRERPDTPVVAPGFSCRSQIEDLEGRRSMHPIELICERVLGKISNP